MGLRANIHPITAESYDAAMRGDLGSFSPSEALDGADLDKTWHAIHYLLTGDTDLRFLLSGCDVAAYGGHVTAHSPQEVAALHTLMSSKTNEQIMTAFGAELFNELGIYPDGWDASAACYLAECLERFRRLIQRAANKGYGIAVTLA